MNIQAVNGLTFHQKKFRVAQFTYLRPEGDKIVSTTRYQEYVNPEAERLYKLFNKEKNPQKKEALRRQMGMYEIVEEDFVTDRILPEIKAIFTKKK